MQTTSTALQAFSLYLITQRVSHKSTRFNIYIWDYTLFFNDYTQSVLISCHSFPGIEYLTSYHSPETLYYTFFQFERLLGAITEAIDAGPCYTIQN